MKVLDCSYRYQHCIKGHEYAIKGINLVVLPSRILGIAGANGAGKSTLVYMLAGLLKPSSGTILVEGTNLYASKAALAAFRKSVALVSQFPEDQFFTGSLYHELSFGLEKQGLSKEAIRHRVLDSLKELGLEDDSLLLRSPFEFGGGEQRLISIAAALVMKPKILILDEPTAGLDAMASRLVWKVIHRLRHRLKISVIVVSHELEKLIRVVDNLIILHEGRIISQGSLEEIFSRPEALLCLGLELPQITLLGWELKRYGIDSPPIFEVREAAELIKKWLKRGAW